jgi:hypothetical protein
MGTLLKSLSSVSLPSPIPRPGGRDHSSDPTESCPQGNVTEAKPFSENFVGWVNRAAVLGFPHSNSGFGRKGRAEMNSQRNFSQCSTLATG